MSDDELKAAANFIAGVGVSDCFLDAGERQRKQERMVKPTPWQQYCIPCHAIDVGLDADDNVVAPDHAVKTLYQVWDQCQTTICSCDSLETAHWIARLINQAGCDSLGYPTNH